jgi:hypothetical protein
VGRKVFERVHHFLEQAHLLPHLFDMRAGDALDIGRGAGAILPQRQEIANLGDG